MGKRERFPGKTKTRLVTEEQLRNGDEERLVRLALLAKAENAGATIALLQAKGWRFRLLLDSHIDLWVPTKWKPVTWTIRNAALWRAIDKRGISLK